MQNIMKIRGESTIYHYIDGWRKWGNGEMQVKGYEVMEMSDEQF